MFRGSGSRLVAAVAAAGVCLALPSCDKGGGMKPTATPVPSPPPLAHGQRVATAIFFIDVNGTKQTLFPDKGYIWIGNTADDVREVWWVFTHKKAEITLKSPANPPVVITIPQSACGPLGKAQVCKWSIPKNSIDAGIWKFTLTGKNDHDDDLEKLDPDIEVDK